MLKTVTIAIGLGALGLVVGAMVPAGVAYSILFLRRHGRQLRTFLRLGGRLLVASFVLVAITSLILIGINMLGHSGELFQPGSDEFMYYSIGGQIGFWGGIVALIAGIRRGRADRGATQTRVSQS
jgi:hypothetical protein